MAVLPEHIDTFRRMIAEPDTQVYTDHMLVRIIERYAQPDQQGRPPLLDAWGPHGAVVVPNPHWVPTYDMHRAAAAVWAEKAAAVANRYAYSADGASYQRHQLYQHALQMERFHMARRHPATITLLPGV